MTFEPTEEQLAALALFWTGESFVIEALAGTGKTSTLRLIARASTRRGRYLAYNRAIVDDVRGTLPDRFAASTAHSAAFQAIGRRYAHRLNGPRMKSWEIAQRLDVGPIRVTYGAKSKVLSESFLAGLTMRALTRFCQTADDEPGRAHFPYVDGIDLPDSNGRRTYENNDRLAQVLEGALARAWADVVDVEGGLPFQHGHYLKLWQLSRPRLPLEVVLFDEAQDANPVMAAVVADQDHAQRVYVGDSQQAIYEWTGAVNALAGIDEAHRATLTQSFRFGPAIAAVANRFLTEIDQWTDGGSPLRVKGLASIPSTVGYLEEEPDAILCRTNATAVETILSAKRRGRMPHLVGGGTEIASFARAAAELKARQPTGHPDLACFESWGEVEEYVRSDMQGDELRLMVDLVEEFGVPTILAALEQMPPEDASDLIVTTAHKAKGREWDRVRIAEDFALVDDSVAELRLRYVACTRARLHLDAEALEPAMDGPHGVVRVESEIVGPLTLGAPERLALPPASPTPAS